MSAHPDVIACSGPEAAMRSVERGEILNAAGMAKLSGVPVEMSAEWCKYGKLTPALHANGQYVPAGGQESEYVEWARMPSEGARPVQRWKWQPAAITFQNFWSGPRGRERLLSPGHRAAMRNLVAGNPVWYANSGTPLPDVVLASLADAKHAADRGEDAVQSALNKADPRTHDARAAAREKRATT